MRDGRTAARVSLAVATFAAFAVPARAQQGTAADSAWMRGDHVRAEQLYRARLAGDSTDAIALHRLAVLTLRARRFAECNAFLTRVLALHPNDTEARVTRARLLAASGRFAAGVALVDSILAARPDDVAALQAKGQFAAWNGNLRAAERAWSAALQRDPANTDSRLGLARTLRQQGRADAAARVLQPVTPDPHNRDLLDEFDRIARSTEPRAGLTVVHEDDSDGNAITTVAAHAALRPRARIELRTDAYVRAADFDAGAGRTRRARGATVTLWAQREPGWAAQLGGGASRTDARGAATLSAWSVALSSPGRERVAATLSFAQTPYDVTAVTADNAVSVREAAIDARLLAVRDWRVQAQAGLGRFRADGSGDTNDRWRLTVETVRRANDWLGIVLGARAFGFSDDTNDGYFDPDRYTAVELGLRADRELRHWHLEAETLPGLERIGRSGDAAGSLRARGAVTYLLRPGRQVRLSIVYANAGLQQLSPTADSDYRYASAGVALLWRF